MQVLAITIQKEIAKAFLSAYFLKYKFAFQILDGMKDRSRRPEGGWMGVDQNFFEIRIVGLCPKIAQILKRSDQSLE